MEHFLTAGAWELPLEQILERPKVKLLTVAKKLERSDQSCTPEIDDAVAFVLQVDWRLVGATAGRVQGAPGGRAQLRGRVLVVAPRIGRTHGS